MNEVRFPYKPNKISFILAITFFGICAGIMVIVAKTNDKRLILNHLIELSPQGATIFYWAIAVAALSFVLIGIVALIQSMFSNREIVITNNSITSPQSIFRKSDITVKFTDITSINMQTVQNTKILNIDHIGGKLSIPNSMLPSKASFEELISQLLARTNT